MWLQQKIAPKDLILLPAIFARALGLGDITREGYHLFKRAKSHGPKTAISSKKKRPLQVIMVEFGCVGQQIMKLLM